MLSKKYFKNIYLFIFLCLCFHVISSYFSFGFYSDDEHFQILEPIAYLKGINPQVVNDPKWYYWEWEPSIRLRPLIQVYFYYFLIKPFEFIQNPFIWSFILRFVSSIIGFLSIIYLFFTFKKIHNFKDTIFNYSIFFCFWFYPFLHSRTSSENLGISVFVFGFCLIYSSNFEKKELIKFFSGIFLIGISVDIRFNLIFSAAPLIAYIMLRKFDEIKLLSIYITFIVALAIGILIDSIFWGFYTNTFVRFYTYNLSSKFDILSDFGTEPWWFYITETILILSPFLSIIFLISMIYFWIKKPLDFISISTFFHFIILSYIGHKEIRYMFPIFFFAPLFIIYFTDRINIKYLSKTIKFILIFSNLLFLMIALFYSMDNKVSIYKYIYNNVSQKDHIYYYGENPYQINDMEPVFYTYYLNKIKKYDAQKQKEQFYIVSNDYNFSSNQLNHCQLKYSTIPKVLYKINQNLKKLKNNWEIYYCKK